MGFKFNQCSTKDGQVIDGLFEIIPEVFSDTRGNFFEFYNQKVFFSAGLIMTFVQDNQSYSKKNVLRGLHFQKKHPQGKLIRVISGKIYDVVVDIRPSSKTFGQYFGIELDSDKNNQLYIPQGFAHGYYVLSKEAVINYKCTNFYSPDDEDGIIWNDKSLNIDWHLKKSVPLLKNRDSEFKEFSKDRFK